MKKSEMIGMLAIGIIVGVVGGIVFLEAGKLVGLAMINMGWI